MAELQTVQKIRDCLDVVEIVMGFLASGGHKAKTRLSHYLATALKMKQRFFSRKVRVYIVFCTVTFNCTYLILLVILKPFI